MLIEAFDCTDPLSFLPQKGNGTLSLADILTYVELTKSRMILKSTNIKKITKIKRSTNGRH